MLAILLDSIGISQISCEVFRWANELSASLVPVTVYYQQNGEILEQPMFPVMQMKHVYMNQHNIVATSLDTLKVALSVFKPASINLLAYDLEWVFTNQNSADVYELYSKANILCRSRLHADQLKLALGFDATVLYNLNTEASLEWVETLPKVGCKVYTPRENQWPLCNPIDEAE